MNGARQLLRQSLEEEDICILKMAYLFVVQPKIAIILFFKYDRGDQERVCCWVCRLWNAYARRRILDIRDHNGAPLSGYLPINPHIQCGSAKEGLVFRL